MNTILNIFHSGGLWVVPLIFLIGSIIFFRKALIAHRSGAVDGGPRVPIYHLGQFWFGVILAIATILSFIAIHSDYIGV